jgi:hypothetical protein
MFVLAGQRQFLYVRTQPLYAPLRLFWQPSGTWLQHTAADQCSMQSRSACILSDGSRPGEWHGLGTPSAAGGVHASEEQAPDGGDNTPAAPPVGAESKAALSRQLRMHPRRATAPMVSGNSPPAANKGSPAARAPAMPSSTRISSLWLSALHTTGPHLATELGGRSCSDSRTSSPRQPRSRTASKRYATGEWPPDTVQQSGELTDQLLPHTPQPLRPPCPQGPLPGRSRRGEGPTRLRMSLPALRARPASATSSGTQETYDRCQGMRAPPLLLQPGFRPARSGAAPIPEPVAQLPSPHARPVPRPVVDPRWIGHAFCSCCSAR